jgi:hypothetical protein
VVGRLKTALAVKAVASAARSFAGRPMARGKLTADAVSVATPVADSADPLPLSEAETTPAEERNLFQIDITALLQHNCAY